MISDGHNDEICLEHKQTPQVRPQKLHSSAFLPSPPELKINDESGGNDEFLLGSSLFSPSAKQMNSRTTSTGKLCLPSRSGTLSSMPETPDHKTSLEQPLVNWTGFMEPLPQPCSEHISSNGPDPTIRRSNEPEKPFAHTPNFQERSLSRLRSAGQADGSEALRATAEALAKLESQMTGQFAKLRTSVVDSFEEVGRRCAVISVQIEQLEKDVKKEPKSVAHLVTRPAPRKEVYDHPIIDFQGVNSQIQVLHDTLTGENAEHQANFQKLFSKLDQVLQFQDKKGEESTTVRHAATGKESTTVKAKRLVKSFSLASQELDVMACPSIGSAASSGAVIIDTPSSGGALVKQSRHSPSGSISMMPKPSRPSVGFMEAAEIDVVTGYTTGRTSVSAVTCRTSDVHMMEMTSQATLNISRFNLKPRNFDTELKSTKKRFTLHGAMRTPSLAKFEERGTATGSDTYSSAGRAVSRSMSQLSDGSSQHQQRNSDWQGIASGTAHVINTVRRFGIGFKRGPFPLMPDSYPAMINDALSLVFLFFDSIMVPYQVAYSRWHFSVFWLYWGFCAALFWTVDMFMRFVTCCVVEDRIIKVLTEIACHNFKHGFALDFFLVAVEWISFSCEAMMGSGGGNGKRAVLFLQCLRIAKVSRVLRALKILQTRRFANIAEMIMARAENRGITQGLRIVISLGRLVLVILWLSHLSACVWILLQSSGWRDTSNNWETTVAAGYDPTFKTWGEAGLSDNFVYFLAFYWSVSIMFDGASFLTPMTTMEIYYAIFCSMFGFLFASATISSMATLLISHQEANREKWNQMHELYKFLRQRKLDQTLSLMIQHQVKERMKARKKLAESDISVMSVLSAELRDELQYHLYSDFFGARPLWKACYFVDDYIIKNLCKLACMTANCAPGEVLFEAGEEAAEAYTIIEGTMQYTVKDCLAMSGTPTNERMSTPSTILHPCQQLTKGATFCELALWTHWGTLGLMETVQPCELLVCSFQGIMEVFMASNENVVAVMRGYAAALLTFIELEKPAGLSDLSSTLDHDSVVAFMEHEPRLLMSMPAIQALTRRTSKMGRVTSAMYSSEARGETSGILTPTSGGPMLMGRKFSQDSRHSGSRNRSRMSNKPLPCSFKDLLHDELQVGKCSLGCDENGGVLRIVRVAALKLTRADGLICVQIGRTQAMTGDPSVKIDLPGKKLLLRETLRQCGVRIVEELLNVCQDHIRIEIGAGMNGYESNNAVTRSSTKYGVPTKYIRYLIPADAISCDDIELIDVHRNDGSVVQVFVARELDNENVNIFAWLPESEYESMTLNTRDCKIGFMVQNWIQKALKEAAATDPGMKHDATLSEAVVTATKT